VNKEIREFIDELNEDLIVDSDGIEIMHLGGLDAHLASLNGKMIGRYAGHEGTPVRIDWK